MDSPRLFKTPITQRLLPLLASLLLAGLLTACDGQAPSEIPADRYAPPPPQAQADVIGEALGVTQPKPAHTAEGEAWLSVRTTPLAYSDGGLLVNLEGEVTLSPNNPAQLGHTRWRQTSGPEAILLNPEQPQAQVILPTVTEDRSLTFTLAAADSDGRVAEAVTRVRVLPPEVPLLVQNLVHTEGPGSVRVTLALAQPPEAPVVLSYFTEDGTALAGQDYGATQGQVTLDAQNPQAEILVEVLSRELVEQDRYFRVRYSGNSPEIGSQYAYVVLPKTRGDDVLDPDKPAPSEPSEPGAGTPEPEAPDPGEPSEPSEPSEPEEPAEPSEPTDPDTTEPGAPDQPEPDTPVITLTYQASSGGRIEGEAQQSLTDGDTGTPVTAIADPGYVFTGWSDGLSIAQRTDTPSADQALHAQFRRAELWMASGHQGDLSVNVGPTSATVTWLTEPDVVYNLIVTQDPLTELDNYSAYGAELHVDVTPPVQLGQLATDQPVYLALEADGELHSWTGFVPRVLADISVSARVIDAHGTSYIAGTFSRIQPLTGGGVFLSSQGGSTAYPLAGPQVEGTVLSAAPDGQGGWYLGGNFELVGGYERQNLAHVNAAGQVTEWAPGTDGSVITLAVDQGLIYAGGGFAQAGGEARARLAAFDAQGQLLPWNPGASNMVYTLAIDQGVIYAGGDFTKAGGEERARLAAFDLQGQLLQWNPGASGSVRTLTIDQGVIYAGGWFSQAGNEDRAHLAAFDAQGKLLPWNPGANTGVSTLAIDHSVIYAGGRFTQAGGEPRSHLAAFDTLGKLQPWNPGVSGIPGEVRALAINQGVIYAGGAFYQAGGESRPHLAAFDAQGGLLPWDPGVNEPDRFQTVFTLAADQGVIFAGGGFTRVGGERRSNLAAFDAQGQLLPWNPGATGINRHVSALAIDQDVIYAGGEFTQVGDEPRSHLAAFDTQGKLLSWNPGANNWVTSLAADQGVIYAAGDFFEAGDEPRAGLAAFGAQGQLLPWSPRVSGRINALAADQGVIYAGGLFTQAGAEPRINLAAFDAQGQLLSWNPEVSDQISALAIYQGVIYSGGFFNRAGGEPRSRLAAFDTQGQLLSWRPDVGGTDPSINTLTVDQGVIYVGGRFTQAGGEARSNLAAFDEEGNLLPK